MPPFRRPLRRFVSDGVYLLMIKLPKTQIEIETTGDQLSIIAACHVNNGYLHWTKIDKSDLPNDLIGMDDLKRAGVDIVDGRAVRCS